MVWLRAGQRQSQAFKILADSVQLQVLETAATAIELIKSQILNATGEFACLVVQKSQRDCTPVCQHVWDRKHLLTTG